MAYIVEPVWSIYAACHCVREAMALVGVELGFPKGMGPATMWEALGIQFDATGARLAGSLVLLPKPARVSSLRDEVIACLRCSRLRPAQASQIIGRYGFINETQYGRVGRAVTGALRARQYSLDRDTRLTAQLSAALALIVAFLDHLTPQTVRLWGAPRRPTILFTDASEEADSRTLGAVLLSPR